MHTPGHGRIVEIGTYHGGSACFLGAGLKRRGEGRLACIDPTSARSVAGDDAVPPDARVLPEEHRVLRGRRPDRRHIGASLAVAATWPAEPIDAVFIDGDHTFQGALNDFECWGPSFAPVGS